METYTTKILTTKKALRLIIRVQYKFKLIVSGFIRLHHVSFIILILAPAPPALINPGVSETQQSNILALHLRLIKEAYIYKPDL